VPQRRGAGAIDVAGACVPARRRCRRRRHAGACTGRLRAVSSPARSTPPSRRATLLTSR
jgi:hypothetical protein